MMMMVSHGINKLSTSEKIICVMFCWEDLWKRKGGKIFPYFFLHTHLSFVQSSSVIILGLRWKFIENIRTLTYTHTNDVYILNFFFYLVSLFHFTFCPSTHIFQLPQIFSSSMNKLPRSHNTLLSFSLVYALNIVFEAL